MPFIVGISSGWWRVQREPGLLGLATKAGRYCSTLGVNFVQVDIDTITEFWEPRIIEQMTSVREKLGINIGFHCDIGESGAFESGLKRVWEKSQESLIDTLINGEKLKTKYMLYHASVFEPLSARSESYRISGGSMDIVDFKGRSFADLAEENKEIKKVVITKLPEHRLRGHKDYVKRRSELYEKSEKEAISLWEKNSEKKRIEEEIKKMNEELNKLGKEIEELKKANKDVTEKMEILNELKISIQEKFSEMNLKAKEFIEKKRDEIFLKKYDEEVLYPIWKDDPEAKYLLEDAEITGYLLVAHYMKLTGDPIWAGILNQEGISTNISPEELYEKYEHILSAIVSCKYIEGHLTRKEKALGGLSPLEFAEKHGIEITFETPNPKEGYEGLMRLINPNHIYVLIKKLNSSVVKMTLDFEHMLANKINPEEAIKKLPKDSGKYINVLHLGGLKPYWGTAHIPLQLGSEAQEMIYKWLWELKKKGFYNAYLIFERGGGETPEKVFEESVTVLKTIAEFLEKNVKPEELPLEFYGLESPSEKSEKRQLLIVKDHALEPLKDLLEVPEEEWTFLSQAAVKKGKGEVWKKRELR